MVFLAAMLILIGLVLLVGFSAGWQLQRSSQPQPADDPAAPYRQGLHAAVRMQRVAQDLEQQIYAEAARHLDDETSHQAKDSPGGER
jgi:uncharacterized protein HemX